MTRFRVEVFEKGNNGWELHKDSPQQRKASLAEGLNEALSVVNKNNLEVSDENVLITIRDFSKEPWNG